MIYFEYGGGLGDVINQIYRFGSYQCLEMLDENLHAKVGLICHNTFVTELFENHPKKQFFEVLQAPYFHGSSNEQAIRNQYGLNHIVSFPQRLDLPTNFYNLESDAEYISKLDGKKYIVVLPNAGQSNRSFSKELFASICEKILSETDFSVVYVDRTYERFSRENIKYDDFDNERFINFCDKISVPATINLIKDSVGVISAHSSMIIPTWHVRKPNLCLYPLEVANHHFLNPDEWSFGSIYDESFCGTFYDYPHLLQGLLDFIK